MQHRCLIRHRGHQCCFSNSSTKRIGGCNTYGVCAELNAIMAHLPYKERRLVAMYSLKNINLFKGSLPQQTIS